MKDQDLVRLEQLRAKVEEQANTIRQLLSINSALLESLRENWKVVATPLITLYGEADDDAESEPGPCQVSSGSTRPEDQDMQAGPGDEAA
jgi:hypothetical protein